jgi:hypothetical protein
LTLDCLRYADAKPTLASYLGTNSSTVGMSDSGTLPARDGSRTSTPATTRPKHWNAVEGRGGTNRHQHCAPSCPVRRIAIEPATAIRGLRTFDRPRCRECRSGASGRSLAITLLGQRVRARNLSLTDQVALSPQHAPKRKLPRPHFVKSPPTISQ